MNQLLSSLPAECADYDNTLVRSVSTRVFESETHPYRSNMDETTTVCFPGATSVVITFDSCSRTEHECDYLIFHDMNDKALHEGKFSGRDGNQNFPGVGSMPPLTINLSEFKFLFHSDASVEDWGYKFTAQGVFPPEPSVINRHNWLLKLTFETTQALCSIGTVLMKGPEKKLDLEMRYAHFMDNSLVKPELFLFKQSNLSAEDAFLYELIERREGSIAEKFVKIMKVSTRHVTYLPVC
jgi:hypothetical protein